MLRTMALSSILFSLCLAPLAHSHLRNQFSQEFLHGSDDVQLTDLYMRISSNNSFDTFEPNHLGLFSRQTRECVSPGYVSCGPNSDYCCPAGDDCFTNGCCTSGRIPCSATTCYNPNTEVCCSSGLTCSKGENCQLGGCCPGSEVQCGNSKCYDPETQRCCLKDGRVWACPASSSCCSVGYCYDPDSEICCEEGSCKLGTTCCNNECCNSIAFCGSNGYCVRKSTPAPAPIPAPNPAPAPAPSPSPKPKPKEPDEPPEPPEPPELPETPDNSPPAAPPQAGQPPAAPAPPEAAASSTQNATSIATTYGRQLSSYTLPLVVWIGLLFVA